MTRVAQDEMVEKLVELRQLSPDIRFGQLLANIALLVEDRTEQTLWDIEDPQLLEVIQEHRDDLARRDSDRA